jgi:large subunit ribosomal protein L32
MLPVTKKSKSRTRTRRAHQALRPVHLVACPQCGRAKLPHAACGNCGYVNSQLTIKAGKQE